MVQLSRDYQSLLSRYWIFFSLHNGQYLEHFHEHIEFLLETLDSPMSQQVLGPASLEGTIHIVHQVVSALYLGMVHQETKNLRKARYSRKVEYHLSRISARFYGYFVSLACVNDVHKNLHEFQRDEMGFSQFANIWTPQDDARGGRLDPDDPTRLEFSASQIDRESSRSGLNQHIDTARILQTDPDTINVLPEPTQPDSTAQRSKKNKKGKSRQSYEDIQELEKEFFKHGLDPKEEGVKFDYPKWNLRSRHQPSNHQPKRRRSPTPSGRPKKSNKTEKWSR